MKLLRTLGLYSFSLGVFTLSSGLSQAADAANIVDPLANPPSALFSGQTQAPAPEQVSKIRTEVLVTDLVKPRSLAALPGGNVLVTEGSGTVRVISIDGSVSEPIEGMPAIRWVADRSMNDFIVDANFSQNRRVYLTYEAPPAGEAGGEKTPQERSLAAEQNVAFQQSQVATGILSEDLRRIENVEVIAEIPGRRLASSPDGSLYITVMGYGDVRTEVQDLTAFTGKVLKINADGSLPDDNPYAGRPMLRPEIFAVGHRDQDGGFVHQETNELWTIEHGPMGGDELNVIRKGQNYGWPNVTYGKNYDGTEIGPSRRNGTVQPLYYWFPSVAPSGLIRYDGDLFPQWRGNLFLGTMSPTEGKFLVRLVLDGEKVVAEEHLLVENDRRIRAVTQGANGALYVLTDSEDNNQTDRHFAGQVLKLTP